MSILQKPGPRFWSITKAVWCWSHFAFGFVDVWPHPGQAPVEAVGVSWQTQRCSKALGFVSSGGQ